MTMYPAQTSLIPVHIALARFVEQGGNIFGNYPYWYLGTTPFRYLTGPVIPFLLVGLHRIFPGISLFTIMFWLIGVAWIIGGIGWWRLLRELGKNGKAKMDGLNTIKSKLVIRISVLFYLLGPIVPFLFRFGNGIYLIAFSFVPFALLAYLRVLAHWQWKNMSLASAAIAAVFLIDTSVAPSLIVGMIALLLATMGWKNVEKNIQHSLLVLAGGFVIAMIWYSPLYFWQLLVSPSFAGKPLYSVLGQLAQLLPIALAMGLAFVAGKLVVLKRSTARFCFYWCFMFGFITFLRFIADPDFWLDWSFYAIELQLGLGMLLAFLLSKIVFRGKAAEAISKKGIVVLFQGSENHDRKVVDEALAIRAKHDLGESKNRERKLVGFLSGFLLGYACVFLLISNTYVLKTLQKDVSQTVEYRIGEELAAIVKPGETVFLSGTTTFWLNALFDIPQVRGGADQASVNPSWRGLVWEVREGMDIGKSISQLRELGVSYLVVHTERSGEFYHDFVNPDGFEGKQGLQKLYESQGDRIYRVSDSR